MAAILFPLRRKAFWAATTLSFFVSSLFAPLAFAANRFWVGTALNSNRWESTANWAAVARGAGGQSIPGASDTAILSFTGGTVTLRGTRSLGGLTLTNIWTGSLLLGTGTLKVGSAGINVGSGRLIGGYSGSGIEVTATASGFTQTGGIVSLAGPLLLSGSFKVQNTRSTATDRLQFTSTGTITLNGTANQTFTDGEGSPRSTSRLTALTLNNRGASNTVNNVIVSGSTLGLSGALTVTLGTLDLTTNSVPLVDDNGNISIANSSTARLTTNSSVTHSGTLTVNYLAGFTVTAGTWTVIDDSDTTYTINGPARRFFNLELNDSGGGTNDDVVFAGSGVNISGTLTVTLGNMDLATNAQALIVDDGNISIVSTAQATFTTNSNVTHSGTLTVGANGGFTAYNGTWTIIDDSDTTYAMNGAGKRFYNLTLNNTAGASQDDLIISGTSLNMSGTLTITRGKVDLSTNSITSYIGSGVTIGDNANSILSAGNMYVGGDWTRYLASIYTHNNGTVTLNGPGTQTVTGSTIFYSLAGTTSAARTIKFAKGEKQIVTNGIVFTGAASNKLSLQSTTGGSQWKIQPSGTRDVSYLDVKDSNNLGVIIACSNNCTDSGNNTNWDFTATSTSSSTGGTGGTGGGGGGRRAATSTTTTKPKLTTPVFKPVITNTMTAKERMEARKEARMEAASKREARKEARLSKRRK